MLLQINALRRKGKTQIAMDTLRVDSVSRPDDIALDGIGSFVTEFLRRVCSACPAVELDIEIKFLAERKR